MVDQFCGLCCHRFQVGEQMVLHLIKSHPNEVYDFIMEKDFRIIGYLREKYIVGKCEHKLVEDGIGFHCVKCGEEFCAWVPLTDERM